MRMGRTRVLGCAAALAAVAALLAAPGAPAGSLGPDHKHPGGKHERKRPSQPDQLRGAMLTPNWSVSRSPFAMTGAQQYAEVRHVCSMGGDLLRFSVDWSQLQPGDVNQGYLARVDEVMNWAAACRVRVILDLV